MTAQSVAVNAATDVAGGGRPGHFRSGRVVSWVAQLVVAAILAQTLVFKFTYAPETRSIFESRGGLGRA